MHSEAVMDEGHIEGLGGLESNGVQGERHLERVA